MLADDESPPPSPTPPSSPSHSPNSSATTPTQSPQKFIYTNPPPPPPQHSNTPVTITHSPIAQSPHRTVLPAAMHIPAHLQHAHALANSTNPMMALPLAMTHQLTPHQLAQHFMKSPFAAHPSAPLDLTCNTKPNDVSDVTIDTDNDERLVENNPEIFLYGRNRHSVANSAVTSASTANTVTSPGKQSDDVTPPDSPVVDPVGDD